MLTQNYCQLKAQWNKTDLHYILDFTECKQQALGKHSFKLCFLAHKIPSTFFFAGRNFTIFLFHFLKHLPFIEDKPKLKKLQTMSETQALEDAGETDEKK